MGEFTPSQHIKSVDIDNEYDKLHAKHQIALRALNEIESWPHGCEGYDTAGEAAHGMNARATEALSLLDGEVLNCQDCTELRELLKEALRVADGRLFNVTNKEHADVFNKVRDYLA